jgi:hypothetical protein
MQLGISCKTYKLLGLRIDDDDDLKWGTNTEHIITKLKEQLKRVFIYWRF